MVRRRTAVSIAAAALLAASPALTACGSEPAHPGAAAVVGDQKITVSALQAQVNEVRAAARESPEAARSIGDSGALSAHTLGMLVQNKVIARAVADAGLTVSDAEVQRAHAQGLQQFGGEEAQLDTALLQQYGVAPSGVDAFFRANVGFGKLTSKLGYVPGTDAGGAAAVAAVARTAKSLGVRINPRYGSWDARRSLVGPGTDPWVVTKTQAGGDGTTA